MYNYYNKAIFKAASLADPIELFNKGEWTWDAMIKAGQELTTDTDEDGTTDQFGYA